MVLETAVREATASALVTTISPGSGTLVVRFGAQADIKPITASGSGSAVTDAAVAGYVDAVGYLSLDVFTAHMSGNSARLGVYLARYGFHEEWGRLASALLEASDHTDHRLPEVFAGLSRTDTGFPVRCPTASSPQAWATGSVLMWLGLALGLRPGVEGPGKPQIPLSWGALSMEPRRSSDQVQRSG